MRYSMSSMLGEISISGYNMVAFYFPKQSFTLVMDSNWGNKFKMSLYHFPFFYM